MRRRVSSERALKRSARFSLEAMRLSSTDVGTLVSFGRKSTLPFADIMDLAEAHVNLVEGQYFTRLFVCQASTGSYLWCKRLGAGRPAILPVSLRNSASSQLRARPTSCPRDVQPEVPHTRYNAGVRHLSERVHRPPTCLPNGTGR